MPDEKPHNDISLADAAEAAEAEQDGARFDAQGLRAGGLLASGLGGMLLAGPPPLTLERLDAELRSVWLDLESYDRQHPSDQVRLAFGLLGAVRLLLSEAGGTLTSAEANTARARLAHEAKGYVKAHGGAWFDPVLNGYVGVARWVVTCVIERATKILAEKFPGQEPGTQLFASVVAALVLLIWDHDHMEPTMRLLRQKGQPTEPPNFAILSDRLARDMGRVPVTKWSASAERVLACCFRAAGADRNVIDSLIVRPFRGK